MSSNIFGFVSKRSLCEESEFDWKIDISNNTEHLQLVSSYLYCESPIFIFGNFNWKFVLIRHPDVNKPIGVVLECADILRYPVEYTIGLKTVNDDVEQLGAGVLRRSTRNRVCFCFSGELQVLQHKNELAPSDVLTVTCRLKCTEQMSNPGTRKLIKLETLSENFRNLFHDKESCDITLNLMDGECKAHKTILMARSPVFAAMFRHNSTERQTNVVNIPDCDHESFEKFLEFLYCGKLEELTESDALNLYATSEKYQIQDIKTFCSEYLIEHLTVENLCDIMIFADIYADTNLSSETQKFFNNNLNQVLMISQWSNLSSNYPKLAKNLLLKMPRNVKIVK